MLISISDEKKNVDYRKHTNYKFTNNNNFLKILIDWMANNINTSITNSIKGHYRTLGYPAVYII